MEYKSNKNVVYSNKYHCVWCTKYRRNLLKGDIKNRLLHILKEVIAERSSTLIESEVMPDHLHLLIEVDPQYGIHKLVKQMKGRSSRYLRKEFPKVKSRVPTLWTNSYFLSSVGGAPLNAIKEYIKNQTHV